jgi:hypothetical protein
MVVIYNEPKVSNKAKRSFNRADFLIGFISNYSLPKNIH